MKRFFMILSAALSSVGLTFGQEDSVKLHLKNSPDSVPLTVAPFSTHPMPNGYRGDNCVSMPNAYQGDNSVPIPNVYRNPIMLHHPSDSTQQPLKKNEGKKKKGEPSGTTKPKEAKKRSW